MKITTKLIKQLTDTEYDQCMAATFNGQGSWGSMGPELRRQRTEKGIRPMVRPSRAYMAWEGDNLLGWALGFDTYAGWNVYIYVHRKHRRKGIGSKLIARTRMGRAETIFVHPHDKASDAFYKPLLESGKVAA